LALMLGLQKLALEIGFDGSSPKARR
jgi:hypothetical protein